MKTIVTSTDFLTLKQIDELKKSQDTMSDIMNDIKLANFLTSEPSDIIIKHTTKEKIDVNLRTLIKKNNALSAALRSLALARWAIIVEENKDRPKFTGNVYFPYNKWWR